MSEFEVALSGNSMGEFYVKFEGPKDSPFEGGTWKVHVTLPVSYPYKSPSIGFCNTIFHPNIDETSGSVCLDVINQAWSPMYDLVNIFQTFLPQLLLYPNPSDPLNARAAALMMQDKEAYTSKVSEYVQKFASAEVKVDENDMDDDEDDDDEEEDEVFSDADDDKLQFE